ncbi:hypothetical protein LX87_03890 [Larkinella arboricola]|uniref:PA14 domain-containing protein n=1 Tax=Larkinella arboricola TaxID=643671 RepID=A0A327WPU0_LARAB|nr:hypothetical protein [Larkinella arboricola]RAJ94006.1 hypothetical protein LX87_03890 [Larkinella arboricola]
MNPILRWFSRGTACLLMAGTLPVWAQSVDESLTPLPTDRLPSLPSNWKPAATVLVNPLKADSKTKNGSGVLVGTPGQPVTLLTNASDVRLVMDVMLTPGAEATLSLGSTHIRLADNWGNATINTSTFGAVEGATLLPLQNAGKAPGLWQPLEVQLQSGGKGPATLEKMTLNGITLYENLVLPRTTSGTSGTISLNVKKGTVAVRNVGYQLISDRQVAKLTNIRYKLYENRTETVSEAELANLKLVKEDTVSALTYEVSFGQPRWHGILYTGDLVVEKTGPYTVALQQGGWAALHIDGKEVLANTRLDLGYMNTAKINLTAGKHSFKLFFGRSWPRPGLGFFISAPDTKFQALHPRASLPEPDPVGEIAVEPTTKPSVIRSFVNFGPKKKTHCISVGSPTGLNYTVDLNQGALLQVWRGPFADVTEMWYERGEPQLLKPLGTLAVLSAQNPLALLANATQFWPDSLSGNELNYKGLTMDKQGYPTMQYRLRDLDITDAVMPNTDGKSFTRTLTLKGPENESLYCRLASGASLEEVAKGLYSVDGKYFIQIESKAKPSVRTNSGKQELVMPVNVKGGSTTVQYSILW